MSNYNDLNNRQIITISVISAALTFIAILASQVIYYALEQREHRLKSAQSHYAAGNDLLAEQMGTIEEYGVNSLTGQIQIPIDEAIEKRAALSAKNSNEKRESNSNET